MITPNIELYAKFEIIKNGNKHPKYKCTKIAGYYPPMDQLKNPKREITLTLLPSRSKKNDAPPYKLQGKNSLNFTGLFHYYINGELSKYCSGYPSTRKTYGNKVKRDNPFYQYRDDGYLFIMHQENNPQIPKEFELIVLKDARILIDAYRKQLIMGGFDEAIELLRSQSKTS